ncbi:inositol monophosphatase family protein [Sagittula stellata]|uniref:Inositol-1-monophosphatase n=1 Tax=Sagittula stellata (strain ATCC 700073 / DSM 11524 / E-37) TaxID=388399 RepID=A3JY96_SAGS3|nr:inositol monophosphatase [Sagittula stellata]EBA10482.1 putative inositol monophosphatase protein [Sagittula stellata E-37]
MKSNEAVQERAAFLEEVLRSAGRIVKRGFEERTSASWEMKGPQDYLTETDAASERHIREAILSRFPGDSVFGEEDGGEIGERCWIVDPIDGTANFARGLEHFCISIGYVEGRRPVLGGIYNPVSDEIYLARAGHGATLNGTALHVSAANDPQSSTVEMGWSTRVPRQEYLEVMTALLERGFNVRRCGSGALALAQVADGRSDAYVELHMNSWDCIPGLLLVSEAGGAVCPFLSTGDLRTGGRILAAAPGIAEALSLDSRTALIDAPKQAIRA